MKKQKVILLCILLLISTANAETVRVTNFQALPQEMSNWCWAASIQSIFLTKGLQVSQRRIVTAAYGAPINRTAPGFHGTLRILNGLSVSADGSTWLIRASAGNTFPNANWLLDKLDNNEPVMIWYRDPNSNHSIIVNGGEYFRDHSGNVQWRQLYAYDPWFNRNMTINATNIPRYVYGTFDVELEQLSGQTSFHVTPQPRIQIGGVCYTSRGQCLLAQPLLLRSQCYCTSPFGPVYGQVGN